VEKLSEAEERTADNRSAVAAIRALAVSDDGAFLDVAQGVDDAVRCDAHTGRALRHTRLSRGKLSRVRLGSRDATWVGVTQRNEVEIVRDGVRLWQGPLPDQQRGEILMECSPCRDDNRVAVVSKPGTLWILDVDDQRAAVRGRYSLGEPLADVKLSPVGDVLALVTGRREFCIWDVERAETVARLAAPGHDARFASWSGDGRWLVTFGDSRTVSVWNALTGQLVRQWNIDNQMVQAAELTFDGTHAAVGDGDEIRLWNVETGEELPTLSGHRGLITVLRFAERDHTLFSGDTEGGLNRWSLTDYREIWAMR
jgi:WD40 repeat protein